MQAGFYIWEGSSHCPWYHQTSQNLPLYSYSQFSKLKEFKRIIYCIIKFIYLKKKTHCMPCYLDEELNLKYVGHMCSLLFIDTNIVKSCCFSLSWPLHLLKCVYIEIKPCAFDIQIGPKRMWPGGLWLSRSIGDMDDRECIVHVPHV